MFWGESAEEAARASLRVTLNKLRQATGGLVTATWQEVGLNPEHPIWLDAAVLEAAAGNRFAWQEAVSI